MQAAAEAAILGVSTAAVALTVIMAAKDSMVALVGVVAFVRALLAAELAVKKVAERDEA